MDFAKFDMRYASEAGQWLILKDPSAQDGVELSDGPNKPCRVLIRGVASRTVQGKMRDRQRAKISALKGRKADDDARVMEDIHNELCDAAAELILGFENIELAGVPLTTGEEDIRYFLDLSFPLMGAKLGEEGEPALNAKGDPIFEMKNNPFAKQIGDFAAGTAAFLGKPQTS